MTNKTNAAIERSEIDRMIESNRKMADEARGMLARHAESVSIGMLKDWVSRIEKAELRIQTLKILINEL